MFFVRVVAGVVRVVLVVNLRRDAALGRQLQRKQLRRARAKRGTVVAGQHVAVRIRRRANRSVRAERREVAFSGEVETIDDVAVVCSTAVP